MTTRTRLAALALTALALGAVLGRSSTHFDDPHCADSRYGTMCVEANPNMPGGSELILYPTGMDHP